MPRLESECKRLGIPPSFVEGVYSVFAKAFEYTSFCEPVKREGEIQRVRIRIGDSVGNKVEALMHFYHEMWHAKEYYEGLEERSKHSEFRATLYSWKRLFEELLGQLRQLK